MLTNQLTVLPAAELRNVLYIALTWVRRIEAKFGARDASRRWSSGALKGIWLFCVVTSLIFIGCGIAVWGTMLSAAIVFILVGAGCIPLGIILSKKSRAKSKATEQKFDEEIVQLIQDAKVLKILPTDYWSPVALEYMIDLLDKGRATAWAQCADKYEEQVHRWALETNTAEAARYAESASQAATWAALGAWLR